MDINDVYKPSETAKCILVHPITDAVLEDDQHKPFFIEVAGKDSGIYRQAKLYIDGKLNQKIRKGVLPTPEQTQENALELLVKCTKDWYVLSDGKKLTFNEENVRTLYREQGWIKEQVDTFIHDRANFTQG